MIPFANPTLSTKPDQKGTRKMPTWDEAMADLKARWNIHDVPSSDSTSNGLSTINSMTYTPTSTDHISSLLDTIRDPMLFNPVIS